MSGPVGISCDANKPAYDHLSKKAIQYARQKRFNEQKVVAKAMQSLLLYPLPLESVDDCMRLQGVGPKIAAEMMSVLNSSDANASKRALDGHLSRQSETAKRSCRELTGTAAGEQEVEEGAYASLCSSPGSDSSSTTSLRERVVGIGSTPLPARRGASGKAKVGALFSSALCEKENVPSHQTPCAVASCTATAIAHDGFGAAAAAAAARQANAGPKPSAQGVAGEGINSASTARQVGRSRIEGRTARALVQLATDWETVLVVDTRERDSSLIQATLLGRGIKCEVATLSLGDFLWVCRPVGSEGLADRAFVVDCIAERKTAADLAASIVDGRYKEQKLRLQECGLRSRVYIVEGLSLSVQRKASFSSGASLKSILVATQIHADVQIIRTRGIDHSISTLAALHRQVARRFAATLAAATAAPQCSGTSSMAAAGQETQFYDFKEFQKAWGKKQASSVGQLFGHCARQIPWASAAAARGLGAEYSTFAECMQRLHSMKDEPRKAIAKLSSIRKEGSTNQQLGVKLAETIWSVFTTEF